MMTMCVQIYVHVFMGKLSIIFSYVLVCVQTVV